MAPPPAAAIEMAAPQPVISLTPWRLALAAFGVMAVGVGAVGVVVPGLPTTVFLIIASWCFAKSCPWLEAKLIRNRFFRPFLVFLEPGARMPVRAKVIALTMMWVAISGSCGMFLARGDLVIVVPVVVAGAIGTWFIVKR